MDPNWNSRAQPGDENPDTENSEWTYQHQQRMHIQQVRQRLERAAQRQQRNRQQQHERDTTQLGHHIYQQAMNQSQHHQTSHQSSQHSRHLRDYQLMKQDFNTYGTAAPIHTHLQSHPTKSRSSRKSRRNRSRMFGNTFIDDIARQQRQARLSTISNPTKTTAPAPLTNPTHSTTNAELLNASVNAAMQYASGKSSTIKIPTDKTRKLTNPGMYASQPPPRNRRRHSRRTTNVSIPGVSPLPTHSHQTLVNQPNDQTINLQQQAVGVRRHIH